jgi:hypothetical protein
MIIRSGQLLLALALAAILVFVYKMREQIAERLDGIEDKGEAGRRLLASLLHGPILLQLIASAISKKFYTTLAGVDYMVGTIVEDRRFEKMLLERKQMRPRKQCCERKPKVLASAGDAADLEADVVPEERPLPSLRRCGCCKKAEAEEEEALSREEELCAVVADRTRRLDDLVRVMDVDDDSAFQKRKRIGLAAGQNLHTSGYKLVTKKLKAPVPLGVLTVTVHSAKLQQKGLKDLHNPYVRMQTEPSDGDGDPKEESTVVVEHSNAPTWGSEHALEVWSLSDVRLFLHCFSHVFGRDAFLGECMLGHDEIIGLVARADQTVQGQPGATPSLYTVVDCHWLPFLRRFAH